VAHEAEYHDNMVRMLELIWGEGYMAPGGPGNVSKLLDGTEPAGKRILDIGCGFGGPAMEMARAHGAEVTGIDLGAPLIEKSHCIRDQSRPAGTMHISMRKGRPASVFGQYVRYRGVIRRCYAN